MCSGSNKRSVPISVWSLQWVLNWALYHSDHTFSSCRAWWLWSEESRGEWNTCTMHYYIIIIWPQFKWDFTCGRGVQKYCFLLQWCWNTWHEGTYYAVTGGGTCTFWKSWHFFILFLNTVGYLFMWQKQGCPASVYSKYFICQVLAALVTSSPVLFLMFNWIHFHCSLNFPSPPLLCPPYPLCLAIPIHFLKVLICIVRALHSLVCLRG